MSDGFTECDQRWMQHAIQLAKKAAIQNEVPVGALLVKNDLLIGEGFNQPITLQDPSAHAEILALRKGAHFLKNYRLIETTLYVTLEPCVMCIGALVQARVKRVIFGAFDPKSGAVTSLFKLGTTTQFNHRIIYEGGLLANECGGLLTQFFRERR